ARARAVASPRPDAPPVITAEIAEFNSMGVSPSCLEISRFFLDRDPAGGQPALTALLSCKHQLGLRYDSHELAVLPCDAGLPNRAASADMDGRGFGFHDGSFLGRSDEVGLALHGGGARSFGEVEERTRRTERVGERHD